MKQTYLLTRETALRALWQLIKPMQNNALEEILEDIKGHPDKEYKIVSSEEIKENNKRKNRYKVINSEKEF